ncbi:MAG: hypothetical protein D6773_15840 [Alphaproteobacteria bacterium]|nr:MAG: hypothetical protein D6773_15840 [Alphaproteobacteria bacterium]
MLAPMNADSARTPAVQTQTMPPLALASVAGAAGLLVTGALLLWLERAPALLLQLSPLSAAWICP